MLSSIYRITPEIKLISQSEQNYEKKSRNLHVNLQGHGNFLQSHDTHEIREIKQAKTLPPTPARHTIKGK